MRNVESILVKCSGDLIEDKDVQNEIKILAKEYYRFIEIISGFGTKLSEKLNEYEIDFEYINKTLEANNIKVDIKIRDIIDKSREQQAWALAKEIESDIQRNLRKDFGGYKNIRLVSLIKNINGKLYNINGDEIVLTTGEKYNKIILYSKEGRDKSIFQKVFGDKIEVRYK
jgi:isocitrate/isopropylmalate dehydrogenase